MPTISRTPGPASTGTPLLRIARARPAISAGVSPLARRSTKNAAVCAGSAASSSACGWWACERPATPHQPPRVAARGRCSHRKRLFGALLRQVLAVQQELDHLRRHSRQEVQRCTGHKRSPRHTSRMLCLVAAEATTAEGVRPARGRGDDTTRPCVARSVCSCWSQADGSHPVRRHERTRVGRRAAAPYAPPCRTAQRSSVRGSANMFARCDDSGAAMRASLRAERHRSGQDLPKGREISRFCNDACLHGCAR